MVKSLKRSEQDSVPPSSESCYLNNSLGLRTKFRNMTSNSNRLLFSYSEEGLAIFNKK